MMFVDENQEESRMSFNERAGGILCKLNGFPFIFNGKKKSEAVSRPCKKRSTVEKILHWLCRTLSWQSRCVMLRIAASSQPLLFLLVAFRKQRFLHASQWSSNRISIYLITINLINNWIKIESISVEEEDLDEGATIVALSRKTYWRLIDWPVGSKRISIYHPTNLILQPHQPPWYSYFIYSHPLLPSTSVVKVLAKIIRRNKWYTSLKR